LSWGDGRKLHRFFEDILASKVEHLVREDGRKWRELPIEERKKYRVEASNIMFSLRGFKFGLHQILPVLAGTALPNILRLFQSPEDVSKGLFGKLHIGVLWGQSGKEILGIATLEKTDQPNEAELTAWVHPEANRSLAFSAWVELMSWGQKTSGYLHFITGTDARTNQQRGNRPAIVAANRLGFKKVGIRAADDTKGNCKTTVILKARNWSPPKELCRILGDEAIRRHDLAALQ
jgi:hypothetical protein